ncbi:MAG: hypothetical protein GXP54_12680 [Deltaproteobacteria bacterium]|nr:hypothetical protein [Deltaproteobacteria bacterium]
MKFQWNGKIRVFASALVAWAFMACGGGSSSPELLLVKVHPVTGTTLAGPNQNPFDVSLAKKVRFSVSGTGINGTLDTVVDYNSGQAALPDIPEGYGRQVTVEVCSNVCDDKVAGDIIARGRSVPLTVKHNDQARTIDVFVSPRNSLSSPMNTANPPVPTAPVLGERIGATMTVLDDGRILILGGARIKTGSTSWTRAEDLDVVFPDGEVYDPAHGTFTAVGTMTIPRAFHQAVKISDGRVVILGGYTQVAQGPASITDSIEVFDPESGVFRQSPQGLSGGAGRALFTAGLAGTNPDVIFLAGGLSNIPQAGSFWNMYILDTGTVAYGEMVTTRYNHTMVHMSTYGRTGANPGVDAFILFGGENPSGVVSDVEAFTVGGYNVEPDLAAATKLPGGGRTMLSAVHVPQQGIVYVIGGFTDTGHTQPSSRVDVFREGIKGFNDGEVMFLKTARGAHTSTLIDYNTIVIAGGLGTGGLPIPSTELIIENLECDDMVNQTGCKYVIDSVAGLTPDLSPARAGHMAVFDATRRVFLAGGFSQNSMSVTTAPIYNPD